VLINWPSVELAVVQDGLMIDCCSRELLGWHLARSGRSKTAESALEHALIARFGTLGKVPQPFLLRSDNGLVFTSRSYTALVRSYGLRQEFITPYTPEQNGMVERVIRTLKEQCAHRHRFESLQHPSRTIGDWIGFYNNRLPHQALGMKTPGKAFALADELSRLCWVITHGRNCPPVVLVSAKS
jgi:putative transposase